MLYQCFEWCMFRDYFVSLMSIEFTAHYATDLTPIHHAPFLSFLVNVYGVNDQHMMMKLVKNTLISDIQTARTRQFARVTTVIESDNQVKEDSTLLRYVCQNALPFIASKAELFLRAGMLVWYCMAEDNVYYLQGKNILFYFLTWWIVGFNDFTNHRRTTDTLSSNIHTLYH